MNRRILLACPYPLDSPRGNSVSANRIIGILEGLGHTVIPISGRTSSEGSGDLLIALHARKSATAIESFHAKHPQRPVIILLTGSDLYADLEGPPENRATVKQTLALATRLVVAQGASIADIPETFRDKARVVPKSLLTKVPTRMKNRSPGLLNVVLSSHLRPAKAPLLVLESLALLPKSIAVQVDHYGHAEDPDLGRYALNASKIPRSKYSWHGNKPHKEMLATFAQADLLLNTSQVEGGANTLCEAIQMGLPCLATSIPANAGMLGEDYPGLFPMDDAQALAMLIERSTSDADFHDQLTLKVEMRAPFFTRQAEVEAWQKVIEEASSLST
ncbi:glycosyltransferase [Verrucomicrobiales bacterium]|nr:glycosyltransferase [Verrucomicrobiales bacterium]MDA7613940.1 glycosyltransferase [Verrucomicrobiales bacterium]